MVAALGERYRVVAPDVRGQEPAADALPLNLGAVIGDLESCASSVGEEEPPLDRVLVRRSSGDLEEGGPSKWAHSSRCSTPGGILESPRFGSARPRETCPVVLALRDAAKAARRPQSTRRATPTSVSRQPIAPDRGPHREVARVGLCGFRTSDEDPR